jgi:hypothetical protein
MPASDAAPVYTSQAEAEAILTDADYFYTKARQCLRLAREAPDEGVADTLREFAMELEEKARLLAD